MNDLFSRLLVEELRLRPVACSETVPVLSAAGVNGGPGTGTGTRLNASWELTSRTMASWSDSYVGLELWEDMYALVNKSTNSEGFMRADGLGELAELETGRGLFMTSAILGVRFMFELEGVGGWIARCTILERPFAAN